MLSQACSFYYKISCVAAGKSDRHMEKGKFIYGGKRILKELLENEAFCTGVAVGIDLYQCKVVQAHDRKEPIKIGENLYYVQDGRERLQEVVDKICR